MIDPRCRYSDPSSTADKIEQRHDKHNSREGSLAFLAMDVLIGEPRAVGKRPNDSMALSLPIPGNDRCRDSLRASPLHHGLSHEVQLYRQQDRTLPSHVLARHSAPVHAQEYSPALHRSSPINPMLSLLLRYPSHIFNAFIRLVSLPTSRMLPFMEREQRRIIASRNGAASCFKANEGIMPRLYARPFCGKGEANVDDFEASRIPMAFREIDQFALLASQDNNFGGHDNWFGEFRCGLHGMYVRLYTAKLHYQEIHRWRGWQPGVPRAEYHLSIILFGMQSTFECMVYMLNALGFGVSPSEFFDVSSKDELRSIAPRLLLDPHNTCGKSLAKSYDRWFPSFLEHWEKNQHFIAVVQENHDVSKHRGRIFIGGELRKDPPTGFWESLAITEDDPRRQVLAPFTELLLAPQSKIPRLQRSSRLEDAVRLECLFPWFLKFVEESGLRILADARMRINLPAKAL